MGETILLKSVKEKLCYEAALFVLRVFLFFLFFVFSFFVSYYFHVNIYVDKKKNCLTVTPV